MREHRTFHHDFGVRDFQPGPHKPPELGEEQQFRRAGGEGLLVYDPLPGERAGLDLRVLRQLLPLLLPVLLGPQDVGRHPEGQDPQVQSCYWNELARGALYGLMEHVWKRYDPLRVLQDSVGISQAPRGIERGCDIQYNFGLGRGWICELNERD